MAWRYVLCDLDGRELGELRATGRRFSPGVSAVSSASCAIRADDPLWPLADSGLTTLKVFDSGGGLQVWGPAIAVEETAQDGKDSVGLAAADHAWDFKNRHVGPDTTGVGRTFSGVDSAQIVFQALSTINSDRSTYITAGNADACVARTVTYLWKPFLDMLNELGAIEGSYEWGLRYVDADPTPAVYLDLLAQWGADRTHDVFLEYGTGKRNCRAYSRARTLDVHATRIWGLGSGSTQAVVAYDEAAEALYKQRREAVVPFNEITLPSLLTALTSAQLLLRKDPREIVTVTPFPKTAPKYGVDYSVGDLVSLRAVIRGQTRVDGAARVWSADIQIDELGNELPALNLEPTST